MRGWPGVPRFAQVLIDQSEVALEAVRGELKGRIAQLAMMAAYRDGWPVLERVAALLTKLPETGGIDELLPFVVYVQATQDERTWRRFAETVRRMVPRGGSEVIDWAEILKHQCEMKGRAS